MSKVKDAFFLLHKSNMLLNVEALFISEFKQYESNNIIIDINRVEGLSVESSLYFNNKKKYLTLKV